MGTHNAQEQAKLAQSGARDVDKEEVRMKKPLVSLLSRMHTHDAAQGDGGVAAGWWDAVHEKSVDVPWGELLEGLEKAFDRKASLCRAEAAKAKVVQEQLAR
jgi:hypothetical protein